MGDSAKSEDSPKEMEKKLDQWRAFFSTPAIFDEYLRHKHRKEEELDYYFHDDIYRREVDSLNAKFRKKLKESKKGYKTLEDEFEQEREEILSEAKLRKTLMSFDTMKKNFYARKKEMNKIKKAFE